jgi:hypothetical protein
VEKKLFARKSREFQPLAEGDRIFRHDGATARQDRVILFVGHGSTAGQARFDAGARPRNAGSSPDVPLSIAHAESSLPVGARTRTDLPESLNGLVPVRPVDWMPSGPT